MKTKTIILSIAFSLFAGTLPVCANTISYTAPSADQPGKFTGELPLARIGSVALPDGRVRFSEDEMLVEAVPDWLFDREPVLKGVIVRAEVAAQANSSVVAGLVYFMDGQWLTNLGARRISDRIITTAGEEIVGRITARAGQAFSVQPEQGGIRKVNFSDIKSIVSPRAFAFNIPTPTARLSPTDTTLTIDSNLLTLAPSVAQARFAHKAIVPKSELAGADLGITNRAIATFIALDIISEIAPAVSIPLVLNRSTQAHALKQIRDALNNANGVSTSAVSGSGM